MELRPSRPTNFIELDECEGVIGGRQRDRARPPRDGITSPEE